MKQVETPRANPEKLLDIIRDAYNGKVVIPEFQRSFVWGREDIEELLVSILQGYFIGTFLMLDTRPDESIFPFRTVEGLEQVNPTASPYQHHSVRLVLDGQQRVTSLFYVLYEPPDLSLKNTKYPYRFFFRLDLALDADPTDAVTGISLADRRRLAEMENFVREHMAVPFSLFTDSSRFYRWFYSEQKFLQREEDKALIEAFYHRFADFMIPVVALSPETGRANIVNIFERINRTGVTLSLFDLAGARLYPKGVKLRDLWEAFHREHKAVAKVIRPEFLLKVIALLQGKEPRRGNLLDVIDTLDARAFQDRWAIATEFVVEAYKRMAKHYGAFDDKWIPYTTMIVPLAALLHHLSASGAGEAEYRKVDRWYWASVFTQGYDSAVDTNTYQDVKEVIRWLGGGEPPDWLEELSIRPIRVQDLDTDEPRSAIYRGLMCLIALKGARDFVTGQPADLHRCEDDHIFAKATFRTHRLVDSIFNRSLISPETNKVKRDKRPSEFLKVCLTRHGNDKARLEKTLQSHFISPEAREAMKADDFQAFVKARGRALAAEVERRIRQG